MNTDRLFRTLSSYHTLSTGLQEALVRELIPLSLPRFHHLLEAPHVAGHSYFLDSGLACSYHFADGERRIDGFWQAGEIIVVAKSFYEQVPSFESVQLMEQSDVYCLSYESLMKLFDSFAEVHVINRMVMNQYYDQCRERIRDLQSLDALQRYEKLMVTYPGIEQAVPQDYIASYLGITPQSLSRIKRQRLTS